MNPSCSSCRFWENVPKTPMGKCRRFPPIPQISAAGSWYTDQTYAEGTDWCGEFKVNLVALAALEAKPQEKEGYPGSWARVVLMVSETGELHAIGGDQPDGEGDVPYTGLERIKRYWQPKSPGKSRLEWEKELLETDEDNAR